MKKYLNLRNVAAIVACLAVVTLLSCNKNKEPSANGNEPSANGNDSGGKITIIGLPSGPAYDIDLFESGTTLNTDADRILALNSSKFLARGGVPANGGNVFYLYKGYTTEKWSNSGTNLIILLSESTVQMDFVNPKIATIPTITNGIGEINYSDFIPFGQ